MTHHEFVLSMLRLVEGDEQQSLLVLLSLLHKILYLLRNGADAAKQANLEDLSQARRTSKTKAANGAPSTDGAEHVLKQGEQLEQLLRMFEGSGDRSRSPVGGSA